MENEEIIQDGIPETEGDVENFVEGFDQLPDIDPPPTTQTESKGRNTTETRSIGNLLPEALKPTNLKAGYDAATGLVDGKSDSVFRELNANIVDFVDNTFLGDKRTKEEILATRDKLEGDARVNFQKNSDKLRGVSEENPDGTANPYSETLGIPIGAALGNLEAGFEIAELGGDLTRYIFNLGNVDPTQNPFNSKYEWATWDLGRNNFGAKSGPGKFAQGLLQFASILKATGGLKGLQGVKAAARKSPGLYSQKTSKVLQRYYASATTAQKFKLTARAGFIGGLYGIPADIITTITDPEQSNLSNLIQDFVPELEDSWLTALSVDEDDSMAEAVVKTSLEGFGLGYAADAVGVVLVGKRVFGKLLGDGVDKTTAQKKAIYEAKRVQDNLEPNTLEQPVVPINELLIPEETADILNKAINPNNTEYDLYDLEELTRSIRSYSVDEQLDWYHSIPIDSRYNVEYFLSLDAQFREFGGYADKIVELPNGTKVNFHFEKSQKNFDGVDGADIPQIDISWNIKGQGYKGTNIKKGKNALSNYLQARKDGDLTANPPEQEAIGNHGKELMTQLQTIVREELRPGQLVANQPIGDIAGEGSAQLRRKKAAFKKASNQAKVIFNNKYEKSDLFWEQLLEDFTFSNLSGVRKKEDFLDYVKDYNKKPDADNVWDALTESQQAEWIDAYIRDGVIKGVEKPNIRHQVYKRAGFGDEVYATQYAIVRSSPDGKGRWLTPVNPPRLENGQLDDEGFAALISKLRSENLNNLQEAYRFIKNSPIEGRLTKFNQLLEQQSKGIPVTWDDVAHVFSEYFTKGSRVVPTEIAENLQKAIQQVIDYRAKNFAGSTHWAVNPLTGEFADPSSFYLDIDGESLSSLKAEDIIGFMTRNKDLLTREDTFLYMSTTDGILKIVRQIPADDEAEILARSFDLPEMRTFPNKEKEAFGFETPETYIKTDGKGELVETRGNHGRSMISNPHERRTVTPTEAAAQFLQETNQRPGQRVSAQRTLTNRQIRLLADGAPDGVEDMITDLVRDTPINIRELSNISQLTEPQILANAKEAMADALDEVTGDIDFEKLLTSRYEETGDVLLTRTGIVQTRLLMQEMSKGLWESSYNIIKLGDASADNFAQIEQMTKQWKALARIYKVSANAHSNLLRASKIKLPWGGEINNPIPPKNLADIDQKLKSGEEVLDKLVDRLKRGDPKAKAEATRLANALLLADGDISIANKLWGYVGDLSIGQGLKIMYNSLLSGPATHLVNITSNIFNTVYRPFAAATGGGVKERKMAIAGYYGIQKTLLDSWNVMEKVYKNGGKAINDGDKGIKIAAEIDAKMDLVNKAATLSEDKAFKAGVGFVNITHGVANFPLFSWPSNMLVSADEFFKTLNARMEYNSRMMELAIDTAEPGNVNEVFENLLKKNFEQNFDINTNQIKNQDLLDVAKEATFQQELEGPARVFAQFIDQTPIMRPFFPFVKTGHNIMIFAGQHVPVLNRFLSEYKTVMRGDDEYAKAIMRGRESFGRYMIMAGGLAAYNGLITGNGPVDPDARKNWLRTHQPRSIKVGNTWIRYDRIEPLGQILAGTADIVYALKTGHLSEKRAEYLAGYMTYSIAANLTQKSFFQGLVPLGKLLTPGWQGLNSISRVPLDLVNSFIPLASFRRTFANAHTPYYQEFNTQFDRFRNQVSWGIMKGVDQTDWLTGEKIGNDNGLVNSILPLKINKRGDDIVRDKLEDIEFDSSSIIKELGGIELTEEHKARLSELMGNSNLYKDLEAWVTHPEFDEAVEEFKTRIRNGEKLSKKNAYFYREIVKKIQMYRDDALEKLKLEFPELNEEIINKKLLRNSLNPGSANRPALTNF
tara:strand:+ start:7718 stop:13243 length:5526 start_codon:yes stop_codon:yes gene_type:complete